MRYPYTAKSGKTQFKPSLAWVERVIRSDNNRGFCLACANTQDNCEPDAARYPCRKCKAEKVYGAEQLLIMGLIHGAT